MSDWSGRRTLVTGAGGFIGSHLTELLVSRGAGVRAYVHYNARNDWGNLELVPPDIRSEIEVVMGDIGDPFSVARAVADCDQVFHLAALIGIPYSYIAPHTYVETNIVGTLNVLEAVRGKSGTRLVHTSTSETYGTARYTPIDEDHPLQGQSPYSASKVGADKMVESYVRSFEIPAATLRPFNTYGPRQSLRAVIPTIAAQAMAGDVVRLGSLSPVRDFTFVTDTARAFVAVAESDAALGGTFNAGNGKGITVGEVAQMILEILGSNAGIEADDARVRPAASEVFTLLADTTAITATTGWQATVGLRDGLAQTIDYIRDRLPRLKPDLYTV
ncbi:MAG: GDP-mannose 4,6-dehydratase [Solirubrobacteraceae bacterium]